MVKMKDFLDVAHDLMDLREKYSDMDMNVHDGYITLNLYIGIANTDMFKDAQKMFAPLD